MHSPMLVPTLLLESPALNPTAAPLQQLEEGYSLLERRRSSITNEPEMTYGRKNTEDALELEGYKRGKYFKREPIIPLNPVKEEQEEVDKDGFKRPRELKALEKDTNENQETTKESMKKEAEAEATNKTTSADCENYRVSLPLNTACMRQTSPMIISPMIRAYSPEFRCYQQPVPYNSEYAVKTPEAVYENQPPSFFYSPYLQPSPAQQRTPQQTSEQIMMMSAQGYGPEAFSLDGAEQIQAWKPAPVVPVPLLEIKPPGEILPERKIGSLTVSERHDKIMKYLEKRKRRIWKKKISYDCRKKVADKRLRIKGRFVTREQAYAILGTTAEDLAKNELLKSLISTNSNCSIITSAQNMKIRNIQTLFLTSDKQKVESVQEKLPEPPKEISLPGKHEIKVEIVRENERDQTVEIKIETIAKKGNFLTFLIGQKE